MAFRVQGHSGGLAHVLQARAVKKKIMVQLKMARW